MSDKRVILITGTRKGIGKYLVEYYVRKGFYVIGCSREVAGYALEGYQHFCLDVSDEDKVKQMFFEISKTYKHLEVLINNAGIISINYALITSLQKVRQMLDTNFIGTFIFCREAAKLMQKKHYGRIVNISTIAVPLNSLGTSIYGASKAGIEQFSKVFAREVASYGITVNTLGLSFVKDSWMVEEISEKAIKETLGETFLKSWLNFEDITNAVDFLISPQSSMITGQTLYLGGI